MSAYVTSKSLSWQRGDEVVCAVAVSCAALATGGGLTVPAAVVAKLPPTSPDNYGFVLVETRNDTSVMAGTRTILLRVSSQTYAQSFDTVN